MLFTALVVCLVTLSGSFLGVSAQQPMCIERNVVVNQLSNHYSEAPVAMCVANNGGVLEILSSTAGKSWTIILTMPNTLTCMIAASEN